MSEEKNINPSDQQENNAPEAAATNEDQVQKAAEPETTEETVVEKVEEAVTETAEAVVETVEETAEAVEEVAEEVAETVEEVVAEATEGTDDDGPESIDDIVLREEEAVSTAHDDYDWDGGKKNLAHYTDQEIADYESMYENTLQSVEENEIVSGRIVGVTNADVVLSIGFKSDGLVARSEFRDMDELTIGQEVDVYVEEKEDDRGQLVLSRKKAKLTRAWESIVRSHDEDLIIEGLIVSKTKGGLIVDIQGLDTFLPGSQIDVKPIIDYDAYVGKKMEFKVVKINEAIKNAVVSHKALIESDLEEQRNAIISQLEKGQVLEGTIKNLTDFGAFIDLGGVDGLLYITDISWGRINHPSEVLELNQKLNVVVLEFDDEKKRISLGLKQLQSHPWDTLSETLEVGAKVNGKVVNIEDYGAFLEIVPGVEGLVHVSEVSWSTAPVSPKEVFSMAQTTEAIIMTLDREDRKMSLSIKRLEPDPWEKVAEKYPVESRHTCKVQNITPYGVFVELEDGIGGMVHISDLSWTKRYAHPSEFTKVGEDLEVVVLEIDIADRKLTLSHKHIEEDPWDTFETVFPIGSIHEGTVVKKEDNGAIVQLQYGLEGFAPNKHIKKQDGGQVEADQTAEFKVLEFDRNDKKIILSHMAFWKDQAEEEYKAEKAEKTQQRKRTNREVESLNRGVEKSTLGDLDVLSKLKLEMEESEAPKPAKKAAAKKKAAEPEAKVEEPKAEEPKAEEGETPAEEGGEA